MRSSTLTLDNASVLMNFKGLTRCEIASWLVSIIIAHSSTTALKSHVTDAQPLSERIRPQSTNPLVEL